MQLGRAGGSPDLPRVREAARRVADGWADLWPELKLELGNARWPGLKGGDCGWFGPELLVVNYRAALVRLFVERLAVWALEGLQELAEKLGIKPLSRKVAAVPRWSGVMGPDKRLSEKLARLWPFIGRMAGIAELSLRVIVVEELSLVYSLGDLSSEPEP